MIFGKWVVFISVHAFGVAAFAEPSQECKKAFEQASKACPSNVKGPSTGEAQGEAINKGAGQLGSASDQARAFGAMVTGVCEKAANECLKGCKGEEEKQCDEIKRRTVAAAGETAQAGQAGQDSQQTADASQSQGGGGGDMMGGMGGMMGALSGLAGMMGKKKDDQKQNQQQPQPQTQNQNQNPATSPQTLGAVDCNGSNAVNLTECNDTLVQACMKNMTDSRCESFASRYCNTSVSGAGSGLGTFFCKNRNAFNYCKQGGREKCPSCLQLAANRSPVCQSDPSLCLIQHSPADINQAKQSCPTDPAFSDPSYVNGGGSQVKGGGLAAPVVSVQSTGGSSLPSAAAQSSNSAAREGYGSGFSPASAGGGSSLSGSGGSLRGVASASSGSALREGYSRGGYRSDVKPASDVQSEQGPSVFVMGSEVLRSRCQAGKLLNCP